MTRSASGRFVSAIYTQNPFYLVSSAVVLLGVQTAVKSHPDIGSNLFLLTGILMTFTCLLGLTGVLIVRLWKVWDDARMIFLVVLLMIGAIAVQFDETWIRSFWIALIAQGVGWLICFGLIESILRFLKLPLPWQYRGVLHALFGLFFFLYCSGNNAFFSLGFIAF